MGSDLARSTKRHSTEHTATVVTSYCVLLLANAIEFTVLKGPRPGSASADVKAEALSLVESFKSFPVNIMCVTQSNGGNIPASGSCY